MRSTSEPALPTVSRSSNIEKEEQFERDVPDEPSLQPLPVEPAVEVSVLLFHNFGYIVWLQVDSAFHPSRVGESSTSLSGWG